MLVLDDTGAYVLVFGALLLFGGRLGDLLGRRRWSCSRRSAPRPFPASSRLTRQ